VRQVARTLDLLNSVSPVVSVNSTICALLVRTDSTFSVLHGQSTTDPLSVEALMHDDDYVAPRSFVGDVLTAAVVRDVLSAQMPPPRIPKSKAKSRLWRFVDSYLPMSRQWFVAAATLQSLLLGDSGAKMVELASIRSPERTLSRSICTNALDAALNVYRQEPLPPLYGTGVHEARLKAATAEFDRLALGCCLMEFAGRLRNDCNALWTGGRQRCEVRSLTDRQCTLALNHAAAHQSDAALLIACSCGSTQRERPDLFSVDDAAAFYDTIGCSVCAESSTALVPLRNNAWRATVIGDYTANGAVQVKQPRFDSERNVLDKDLFSPISPLPKLLDDLLNDKPVPASSAPAGVADLARLVAQAQEQTRALLPTAAAAVAAAASSGTATSSERSPVAVDATAHHRLDVVVRKLSAAIETSCVHGGVGYEFECEQGHRFFEPLDCSTALRACVSASSSRERPLAMACARCKPQTAAQLRRIYVATSARGAQCVFRARVRTESENADEWHDSGAEVVLPAGKLIVLRLPVRAAIKLGDNSMRLMPNAVRLATTTSTAVREE
jgi:hypothetical protein